MNINKKNLKQILLIITFSAFMLWVVFNYKLFIDVIGNLFSLLTPVFIAIVIAFIINIPLRQIENKIFKIEKRKNKKFIRAISLILSIILIVGIIGLILFLIIPELISATVSIANSLPEGYEFINRFIEKLYNTYPELKSYIGMVNYNSLLGENSIEVTSIITLIVSFFKGLVSKVIMFFISFVIGIYMLIDKEVLIRQTKKALKAFTSEKLTSDVFKIGKLVNSTFTNFLAGQCLDAALIGFLLFVVLSILRLPYALTLGVLFAVTALIPYVGAFITLLVGILLIGVVNPIGSIWYIITFFVLQQIDENFTHPRIVGSAVNLPPLWALLAVLLGGSIFGFVGMLISIPVVSILYKLLSDYINEKINKKVDLKN